MEFLFQVIAILFAVSVHESAHAYAADRLGDPTGRFQGRISLNPLAHLDFFGTIALVFFGIGWGKPVPFDPANLKHPKRDAALIALAGPLSNLLSAMIIALPLKYFKESAALPEPVILLMSHFFWISILLFALNVLPFPPLDGSKVIGIFVPRRFQSAYNYFLNEGVKYFIIFILFDVFVLEKIFQFSILHIVLGTITDAVIAFISLGT